ncbi:hypothetical protein TNCV_3824241 [Trichonephila clavipes]|nr:hypothetical protein TNCV_3824241 [Trichonephila clavipes]
MPLKESCFQHRDEIKQNVIAALNTFPKEGFQYPDMLEEQTVRSINDAVSAELLYVGTVVLRRTKLEPVNHSTKPYMYLEM